MPGLAKTNDFMLGTATVMIGPAAELHDLNPAEHSVGLVKNFTITSEPSYTELSQGVKNTIVHSIMTANPVRATMEVYEYTARNLAYSLGLESAEAMAPLTVATTVNGAVNGGSPTAMTFDVTSAAGLTEGAYIMIELDQEDNFIIRKIVDIATLVITVDQPLPDIPDDAPVKLVNNIGIGSKDDQPFYAAKIAGKLANGDKVVILIPKLRIVKGFNMAFTTDNYGNLPMEFTLYDLVNTDTFYAEFGGDQARIFRQ